MKIMTKKLKYCIMIVVVLFSFQIYAVGPGAGIEGNAWKVTTSHTGSSPSFWCNWIYIHFGQGVDAKIKDGEGAGSGIIYMDKTEGKSNDVAAYGYGLYQFDLKKHMVGYLYYLNEKSDDDGITNITKTTEECFAEKGEYIVPPNLKFKDACKYVADKLMATAYSKDTVNNYLNKLLQHICDHTNIEYIEKIKKYQSDYWYKVYAKNAYDVLTGELRFSTDGADMRKVHGALLSIMEDRYRDKNLKNKPRMQLSVEKGDLWPFLVYTETNDNGATTDWQITVEDNKGNKKIIHTDWKKMLTGAYQYMVYYEYKVDDEADAVIDKRNIYNGVKAEMFREEYQTLFNEALPELRGKDLDDFYQRIRRIRRYYKKSSDNGGGVFGEEELYDISSDITYSRAIDKLSAKINGEFRDVFKGLDSDYIARTYLMAKNIADTTRLIEQNAQYDIGSNIVNRTPGGYGEQVLLSDLQLITLKRGDDNKFSLDADKDGLIDGRELGNEDGTYKPLKISGFIKKMLKAEAGDSYSEDMYNMYKANIQAAATAADNAENRGNIVTEGRDKEKFIQTQHDIRVIGDDIYVDVMSYTSNPILKDSDFDGVWDGYGKEDEAHKNQYKDNKPLDNSITGDMVSSNRHFNKSIYYDSHMDYRYFFMYENNYYDELSTMSLLLANGMNKRGRELSDIDYIMSKIGCDNYVRRNASGNVGGVSLTGIEIGGVRYSVEYITGMKVIEYSKDNTANNYLSKLIVPIVIKTPDDISISNSFSEIGETKWADKCDTGKERHNVKSYEVYAELIKDDLERYCREATGIDINSKNIVFWITGHKEAGAIANVLASKYIDDGHRVYAYTFGSPMTLYNNPDEEGYTRTGYSARYDSIFNVVNEEDAYTYILPQMAGFSRYGMTCYGSGRDYLAGNIVYGTYLGLPSDTKEIRNAIEDIFENHKNKTRTYLYSDNKYLSNFFQRLYKAILNYRLNTSSSSLTEMINDYKNDPKLFRLVNLVKQYYPTQHGASTTDVYYYLAKNMKNADITNVVNLHDEKEKKINVSTVSNATPQELMAEAVEVIGQQYVKNVSTYDGTNKYSLKQISKDVDTVYKKNHYNTLTGVDIEEQKEEIKRKFQNLINNYDWFKCGDDCVRFMFSVIFYAQNGDIGTEFSNNNSEKYYTMFGTNILTGNKNDQLFENLGFEIHYIGEVDSNGHEFGYENLEDGDIVVAYRTDTNNKGHVEFYINNRYGKNGNGIYDWSFGWGSRKERYPVNGVIGKTIHSDDNQNDENKKKYLLDNFINLTYDGDNDGKPDRTYELRYFKVLRRVR